jgi:hypothetical protein
MELTYPDDAADAEALGPMARALALEKDGLILGLNIIDRAVASSVGPVKSWAVEATCGAAAVILGCVCVCVLMSP